LAYFADARGHPARFAERTKCDTTGPRPTARHRSNTGIVPVLVSIAKDRPQRFDHDSPRESDAC
jgi:hypothetical protein